ncbi:MogA/MoaB family molybdenum cofactor biosynthesis protein [Halogeometricum borinquense]|uniref:MogA/MoaB family molybdenum cofactor biosynthesis protein n=1 Tax=Halogeometricum borinquense TaxID=60847 RepID=A0A482TBV8_9EURY|nr:MogA/MoaB family molybdenum cofactor biosynthesis protein [Halogeometricum borinquense]RYJ14387.1 MogA/MoaB family molybdenum cofactor biosynthesis protein [Halogeometricum borinquense]
MSPNRAAVNEHGHGDSDETGGHGESDDTDGHDNHDSHDNHGDHDHGHGHDGNDSHDHHHAHDVETLGVAVVTVSSSRSIDEDTAGDALVDAFEGDGHEVTVRELVADDFDGVQSTVNRLVDRDDVDAIVTSGGTGVTPDDVTVEAVTDIATKTLPGFGELFRRLSYEEIGARVIATRSMAGIVDSTPVFCLPGSENAARLGAEEILVPELPHIAGLAGRE